MSHSRTFGKPLTRHDGIAFPSQIAIDSPIAAQDLLHVYRADRHVVLSVSQVEINLAVVRATVTLTPELVRHVIRILGPLADEAERAGT